ncbi:3180_t:CDS:2, partial [Racocetra fulgida]
KVGHKADMKGILINTLCKLEALYGEVSGGLSPFGLSIAKEDNSYLFEDIYCVLKELEVCIIK